MFHTQVQAEPSLSGQTGFINMPDARVEPDGTWRIGLSNSDPYRAGWTSLSLLPWVEVSGRYTRIKGLRTYSTGPGWENYGDYKDKTFDSKFLLLKESDFLPALALGINDFDGTGLFKSKFLAASKQFGLFDATVGAGTGRINGAFAGARYRPEAYPNIALVAEYDANDYKQDLGADTTGIASRGKGVSYGVEYRWGWLGSQLSYQQGGTVGLNAYVSVPLNEREFIPKIHEPEPYTRIAPRPTLAQWQADPAHARKMVAVLLQQDFRNVRLRMAGDILEAELTNSRISLPSRAIGRAARVMLLLSPVETREIRITYTVADLPVATYTFFDIGKLQRYFNGLVSRKELAQYVAIDYATPGGGNEVSDRADMIAAFDDSAYVNRLDNEEGDFVSFRRESPLLDRIRIAPKISTYLNDPSGAFHYETYVEGTYQKHLGDKLFLELVGDLTLLQNVSDVTQPSNSELPHVRSDVADYKRDGKLKLARAVLNKFYTPRERVYARASAGIYEEMFAGAGGQVLYVPRGNTWAADISLDWLKQRDTKGGFGFRDYSTVTALGALHYKLPLPGLTATVRAGRFLAKDVGARFELKRRFRSGFEMGGWYTVTNGNDIASPGTPDKPYHDKGLFLSMPFNTLLTRDTGAVGNFSIAPWTRDVGQMVAAPADLYDLLEKPYINMHDRDGLVRLGDLDDNYDMPVGMSPVDRLNWAHFRNDLNHSGNALASADAWMAIGLGIGVTALSSTLDKPVDRWVERHYDTSYRKGIGEVGKLLPVVGMGVSGLLALDPAHQRLSATAFTSLQAGMVGLVAAEGGKYLFGRARPTEGLGSTHFNFLKLGNGSSSFPSGHTTIIWAAVTPYAKEYEMPWLYGAAALTNIGRVADRKHWVSDTVGGALLGYGIGSLLWESHRDLDGKSPQILVTPTGVGVSWRTE